MACTRGHPLAVGRAAVGVKWDSRLVRQYKRLGVRLSGSVGSYLQLLQKCFYTSVVDELGE